MSLYQLVSGFLSIIFHLQEHLQKVVDQYGLWTYGLLFLIIFAETGLVILPFLPGDSLLFAAGAFASAGVFSITALLVLLVVAAIVGDSINYAVGRRLSKSIFTESSRFFKKKYMEETERFYAKHGGKTILLARFIPIIRTFAPCVAGMSQTDYSKFLWYNVLGGLLWVSLFLFGGFFFGTIPYVKAHFSAVIVGIIFVSVIPVIYNIVRRDNEEV